MTSDDRIDGIVAHLRQREQQNQQVFDKLREFTDLLYTLLEKVLDNITQKSISQTGNIKKIPLLEGFRSFSFELNNFKVLINPHLVVAYPDPNTEFSFPLPQTPVGRVVYFHQSKIDDMDNAPLGETYVYPDGLWYSFGIAGPILEREISEERILPFALSFLEALTYHITSYHFNLKETKYEPTGQSASTSIGYQLQSKKV
jgi:hypothetical protein